MADAHIEQRRTPRGELRWKLRFRRDDGSAGSRTFTQEAAAERWLKVFRAVGADRALVMLDGEDAGAAVDRATVADLVEQHIASLTAATAGTVGSYRREASRDIYPVLGSVPAALLSREDVAAWVNGLRQPWPAEQLAAHVSGCTACARRTQSGDLCPLGERGRRGLSGKTISNRHGLLSAALASAVQRGQLPTNVARGLPLPQSQRRPPCFLSQGQVLELAAAVGEHYEDVVIVAAGTGLRWGELTALQPGDITVLPDRVRISVTRAWKDTDAGAMVLGPPKTRRSRRTLTIGRPSPVADRLVARVTGPQRGRWVFTAPRGGVLRNGTFHQHVWSVALDQLAQTHGWSVRPRVHDLRHTAASLMLAAGADIMAVSRVLGHEKVSTTVDVYGHLADGAAETALGLLGSQLQPPRLAAVG